MPQRHDLVDPLAIVMAAVIRLIGRARIVGAINPFPQCPIVGVKQDRQHTRLAQGDEPARQALFLRIGGKNGLVAFRHSGERRLVGDMLAPRFRRVQHGISKAGAKVAQRHANVEETLAGLALQSHARQTERPQRQFDGPLLRRRKISKIGPVGHARDRIMMRPVLPRLHQISRHQGLCRSVCFPQFRRVGYPCKMADGRPCARQEKVRPLRRQYDVAEVISLPSRNLLDRRAMLVNRSLYGGNHMCCLDGGEIGQVGIGKEGVKRSHDYSWLRQPKRAGELLNWAMTPRSSSSCR